MLYTKVDPENFAFNNPSPSLLYHKWQGYDRFKEEKKNNKKLKAFTTDQQKDYLKEIIKYVNRSKNQQFEWIKKYLSHITVLDPDIVVNSFTTNWRLIVGMGTNPTLETGIQLHHLYGFPYIPGSMVKGLLHHLTELELCKNPNWKIEKNEDLDDPEKSEKWQHFLNALQQAELVRVLFGSLFIKKNEYKKKNREGEEKKYYSGLEVPLDWFSNWNEKLACKKNKMKYKDICDRIETVMSDEATGGMLTFYDAVPAADAFDNGELLQLDIMNPHYQEYYSDTGNTIPPSDDQNPNPIYFLAVKPGAKFVFPYRIAAFPPNSDWRDKQEEERWNVLQQNGIQNQEAIRNLVDRWLKIALTEWGIGAKTAAGYGYFLT